mgnify:CR=1 FL=1
MLILLNMDNIISCLDHGYIKYIGHYGSDKEIVASARISTGGSNKTEEEDRKLINYLMKNRHNSVFEMADITFEVQAPIFVFRELMRHRTLTWFSINELSGRYSEMPSLFYVPDDSRYGKQGKINKQGTSELLGEEVKRKLKWDIENEQIDARTAYEQKLASGLSREIARINLPLSQYSRMRIKGNLLNWFRFIDLRSRPNAMWEIQQYSDAIFKVLEELFPWSVAAFREHWFESINISKSEKDALVAILNDITYDKLYNALSLQGVKKPEDLLAKIGVNNDKIN